MKIKNQRNSITSFCYPTDKEDIMTEFKIISIREHRSQSDLIVDMIEAYVKAHSEGNDTFKLDTWVHDSTFKAVPTILDKDKSKWTDYVNSCNESERRDLTISCNFVLRTIHDLTSKTDIQVQNTKSYQSDRLRNVYDIRNKDPSTLTIYQRELLTRYQKAIVERISK